MKKMRILEKIWDDLHKPRKVLLLILVLFCAPGFIDLCLHIRKERFDKIAKNASVKLMGKPRGSCSGQQVVAPSGEKYILTAGHCRVLADKDNMITAKTEDGRLLERKIIAEDPNSDLLLLEGAPGLEGIQIAKVVMLHEHIRTFTHGKGFSTYRTDGEIIQSTLCEVALGPVTPENACTGAKYRIVKPSDDFIDSLFEPMAPLCLLSTQQFVTTAPIVPGSSGGMAVNDDNELVGIASATGEGFHYFVRLCDIQKFLSGY